MRFGPGVIILPAAGGAWIYARGASWRVSNEQMRGATQVEIRGDELVNRYLCDLKIDLGRTRGARRFVDVARRTSKVSR